MGLGYGERMGTVCNLHETVHTALLRETLVTGRVIGNLVEQASSTMFISVQKITLPQNNKNVGRCYLQAI